MTNGSNGSGAGNAPDIMGELLGRIPIRAKAKPGKVVSLEADSQSRARQLLARMKKLRLTGMAAALEEELSSPSGISPALVRQMERLVDSENRARGERRLKTRLRKAGLSDEARLEDLDYSHERGLDQNVVRELARGEWITGRDNLIITGPVGVGKTYLTRALTRQACLAGFSTVYRRLPDLLEDLGRARNEGILAETVARMTKYDLLSLDDWGLDQLDSRQGLDLLELVDSRHQTGATLIAAHAAVSGPDGLIDNRTIDNAVMDRLISRARRINLGGGSLRREYHLLDNGL